MFKESREKGILPQDQRIATIVAIHKKGKPADSCDGYRPISLIGAEAKILAKILANRLLGVISSLIHPDQSGFMPNRSTALNLRRLHGVLSRVPYIGEPAAVLSLDAKMAFDIMEWGYMLEVLRKMGFGPNFVRWIQLLYTEPLAQVRVNGATSQTFPLGRGTRQGCPLSPLIFALILEPLAVWIRQDHLIRGLNWNNTWEDRISLYADDILLYLADPVGSIERVMHILYIFHQYSGFTINWQKSILFLLKGPALRLSSRCPIAWSQTTFKYLGVYITRDPKEFYELNLLPPLIRLKSDIHHWSSLPLSLLGRAALFKMMSLPRFIYILQNDPFPVPHSYFYNNRKRATWAALGGIYSPHSPRQADPQLV